MWWTGPRSSTSSRMFPDSTVVLMRISAGLQKWWRTLWSAGPMDGSAPVHAPRLAFMENENARDKNAKMKNRTRHKPGFSDWLDSP